MHKKMEIKEIKSTCQTVNQLLFVKKQFLLCNCFIQMLFKNFALHPTSSSVFKYSGFSDGGFAHRHVNSNQNCMEFDEV